MNNSKKKIFFFNNNKNKKLSTKFTQVGHSKVKATCYFLCSVYLSSRQQLFPFLRKVFFKLISIIKPNTIGIELIKK